MTHNNVNDVPYRVAASIDMALVTTPREMLECLGRVGVYREHIMLLIKDVATGYPEHTRYAIAALETEKERVAKLKDKFADDYELIKAIDWFLACTFDQLIEAVSRKTTKTIIQTRAPDRDQFWLGLDTVLLGCFVIIMTFLAWKFKL